MKFVTNYLMYFVDLIFVYAFIRFMGNHLIYRILTDEINIKFRIIDDSFVLHFMLEDFAIMHYTTCFMNILFIW